jgi:hypothetical protein
MCKCRQRDCELEVFEKSDKCILHCEKDDWYKRFDEKSDHYKIHKVLSPLKNNDWSLSNDKIDFFWNEFNNFIKKSTEDESLKCNFNDVVFPAMGYGEYPKVAIFKLKLLSLKNCIFLDCIDLNFFLGANSLEINNCTFNEDVKAKEVIFKGQFLFQNNTVLKNIEFVNIEFKGSCTFMKSKFKNKLIFENIRFNDYALFNSDKTEIMYLLFINTFFRKESNFLNMKLSKVGDRETARIIKDSFEKQNNIIEANKFYALEMKEREKELERDSKEGKNFFEWLVFKIHGLSSNHSQDWVLSLFWILSFSFGYSFMSCVNKLLDTKLEYILTDTFIYLFVIYTSILIINYKKMNKFFLTGLFYIFYVYLSKDFTLQTFSNNLNPFSIMTEFSELNFSTMIYKITIAYLIYQLIISIRQNTRRK